MAIANITNNILTDSGVATSALQIALNGTGFVKISGTTISYDNSTYYLASNPNAFIAKTALSAVSGSGAYNSTTGVITIPTDNNQIANGSGFITSSALSNYVALTGNQTIAGVKTFSNNSKFDGALILKNNVASSLAGYVGLSAYSASGNKGINIDFDTYSIGFYFNGTLPYNYTFPNANGTVALTSDIPDVSGYVTLITAQTITGAKTFTSALNGTSATFSSSVSGTSIRSSAVGSFGFNTANNGEFQIYATALDGMVMAGRGSTNDMVITNKSGSDVFRIPTGTVNVTFLGSVTATSFFESSDSRLKTLIQDNYQTKGIASITPKLYTKNGKVELGYYAQDLVGILDSAVSKGEDDMLSLSYREVLVAKVYALEQRIKELENK
jgi:hypothetical protein